MVRVLFHDVVPFIATVNGGGSGESLRPPRTPRSPPRSPLPVSFTKERRASNTSHLEVFDSEDDAQVFGIRFPTNHVEGASIGFDVDQNINKDLLVNVVMLRRYSKNHGHTVERKTQIPVLL